MIAVGSNLCEAVLNMRDRTRKETRVKVKYLYTTESWMAGWSGRMELTSDVLRALLGAIARCLEIGSTNDTASCYYTIPLALACSKNLSAKRAHSHRYHNRSI